MPKIDDYNAYIPPPDEIAEGLAAIRATWSDNEELKRRVGPNNARVCACSADEVIVPDGHGEPGHDEWPLKGESRYVKKVTK